MNKVYVVTKQTSFSIEGNNTCEVLAAFNKRADAEAFAILEIHEMTEVLNPDEVYEDELYIRSDETVYEWKIDEVEVK